jgi:peptidoglycan hydrolase-like protein with peptidoglycan-binding domain
MRVGVVAVVLCAPACTTVEHSKATVAGQSSPPAALDRFLTRGEIRVVEEHLQDLGFDPGPVDGIFTAQTQAAVRTFQAQYGIFVSGLVDPETRGQLLPGMDEDEHVP